MNVKEKPQVPCYGFEKIPAAWPAARKMKPNRPATRSSMLRKRFSTSMAWRARRLRKSRRRRSVTRGAVYWHFRDKIELCEAMMQRVFLPQEDIIERLAASDTAKPLEDLRRPACMRLALMATDKRRHRVISILHASLRICGGNGRRHEAPPSMQRPHAEPLPPIVRTRA